MNVYEIAGENRIVALSFECSGGTQKPPPELICAQFDQDDKLRVQVFRDRTASKEVAQFKRPQPGKNANLNECYDQITSDHHLLRQPDWLSAIEKLSANEQRFPFAVLGFAARC